MALQLNVQQRNPIALPGNLLMNDAFARVNSYSAGTAAAPDGDSELYWGQAAFYDALSPGESSVVPGTATSTLAQFAGFIVRNGYSENAIGAGHTILNKTSIGVLDQGNMFLLAETAIAAADPVHLIIFDADPTKIGRITTAPVAAGTVIDVSAYVKVKGFSLTPFSVIEVSVSKV